MRRWWGSFLGAAVSAGLAFASAIANGEEPTVDAARVYRDLSDLVAIRLRPSGSPGAARARDLIAERLRQAGFKADRVKLSVSSSAGVLKLNYTRDFAAYASDRGLRFDLYVRAGADISQALLDRRATG